MNDLVSSRAAQAVKTLLQNGTGFTILDVSNLVKKDGGVFVSHQEVRDVVKPFLDNVIVGNGYVASLIEVVDTNGNKVQAVLYHPSSVDPQTYEDRQSSALSPSNCCVGSTCSKSNPVAVAVAPKTSSCVTRARLAKKVVFRSDGSIEIPVAVLTEAGLVHGDCVKVVQHPNSLSIVLDNVGNSPRYIGTNGFRISHSLLAKANLVSYCDVNVCAFSDKVVISK